MNSNLLWLLTVIVLAWINLAEAQQPAKVPLIGHLNAPSLSALRARTEAVPAGSAGASVLGRKKRRY